MALKEPAQSASGGLTGRTARSSAIENACRLAPVPERGRALGGRSKGHRRRAGLRAWRKPAYGLKLRLRVTHALHEVSKGKPSKALSSLYPAREEKNNGPAVKMGSLEILGQAHRGIFTPSGKA